jgi:5'-deoxynucleotidase YfbR-like HD superfamily hydrolase
MGDNFVQQIIQFERWMRVTITGVMSVLRWCSKPLSSPETVLEHLLKSTFTANLLIAYERLAGNPHNLDFYSILYCAGTHDIGEGQTGDDVPAVFKTEEDEKKECQAHEKHLHSGIPMELREFFPLPIDRNPKMNQIHKDFWFGLEHLGYCLFSMGEIYDELYRDKSRIARFWHHSKCALIKRKGSYGIRSQFHFHDLYDIVVRNRDYRRVADFIGVIEDSRKKLQRASETFVSIAKIATVLLAETDRIREELRLQGVILPTAVP